MTLRLTVERGRGRMKKVARRGSECFVDTRGRTISSAAAALSA